MNDQTTMIEPAATQTMLPFDYAELPLKEAAIIESATHIIKERAARIAADVLVIGTNLLDVKTRLNHGQWGRWLATEFAWSDQTAQNYMNVARRFGGQNPNGLEFGPKVLYMLAAPSTPQAAVDEAQARAAAGEQVTPAVAKEIIAEARAAAAPTVAQASIQLTPARTPEPVEDGDFEVEEEPALKPMPPEVSAALPARLDIPSSPAPAPSLPPMLTIPGTTPDATGQADEEIAVLPARDDQALLKAGARCRLLEAMLQLANAEYDRLACDEDRVVQLDQGLVAQAAQGFMVNGGLAFQVAMLATSAQLVEE